MKTLFYFLRIFIISILISISTGLMAQDLEKEKLRSLLETKHFVFEAQSVNPQKDQPGSSLLLTTSNLTAIRSFHSCLILEEFMPLSGQKKAALIMGKLLVTGYWLLPFPNFM